MADTQSILQLGIEAARAGEKAEARELFRLVTREDPGNAQGWLWLAGVAENRDEKRTALERVVDIDPANELARRGLSALGVVAPTPASGETAASSILASGATDTDATPRRHRARVYQEPELAYTPAPDENAGVYGAGALAATGAVPAPAPSGEPRRTVPAEEEREPRRGGLGWLAFPLLLAALALAAFFVYNQYFNRGPLVAEGSPGAVASVEGSLPALGSAAAASEAVVVLPVDTSAAGEPSASAPDASAAPSAVAPSAAAETSAAAPSAPAAAPSAAVPSVAPLASAPAPSVAAPSIAPQPTVAPPTAVPQPTAVPPAPPSGGDVASANPAVVANGSVIPAGGWDFSYGGISNFATGPFGGAPPSRGRYEIVLITVRNTGGAAAQIPDGSLVIKDAQGRVYDFNRAASVDYFNRISGAGDLPADAEIAPSNLLSSVPLLFDVSSDASDLVLFSRDNTAQGFLVR